MNSPAARLVAIITLFRSQVDALPNDQTSLETVWKRVLKINDEGLGSLHRHFVIMEDLLIEIERSIRSIPDLEHEIYVQAFPTIRSLLSISDLGSPARRCKDLVGDLTITTLRFCAERLGAVSPEPNVEKDELDAISEQLDELTSQVHQSDLPKKLKLLLRDLLEAARRGIAEYRFRGAPGLRQELVLILEKLQRHWGEVEAQKSAPVMVKFWEILARIETATSLWQNTPALMAQASTLLPNLPTLIG